MPVFIRLKNKDRIRLFNLVKEKINISWDSFYPSLNISRTMFFNYLSGRYNLPKKLFLNLKKIAKIKVSDYEEINQNKYVKKEMTEPRMSNSFAEILGVLNGDGHISNFSNEVCVVGDAKEKDYLNYLKNLFENKFKISFNFFEEPTRIKLRTYSIILSNILVHKYHLPKGNKLGRLKIPKQVFRSKKWMTSYIRGLFDTDGSIYKRRDKDMVVEIISADERFLREVKRLLNNLGFNSGLSGKHIYLYKKDEIIKFFNVVKPSNTKHLKKYQNYLILNKRR